MSNVKVEVLIDPSSASQREALDALLAAIGGETVATPKKKRKAAAPRVEAENAEPKPEAEETEETPQNESGVTMEQIREKAVEIQKAGDKDKIRKVKAKLTELGAKGVPSLDPKHFESFFKFISEI